VSGRSLLNRLDNPSNPYTVGLVPNEHPYPPAFRSGDLVSVSGRLGVTGELVYEEFFAARTCVGVASLPYGGVVEVETLARVRDV